MSEENKAESTNFIHEIIDSELKSGKIKDTITTRFPPEPNGYLHIGHFKAIAINFSTAEKYKGVCHLRFDDTNPSKEEQEYIDAIQEDIQWLGYQWDRLCYASDYFQQMYDYAVELIKQGKAYVCHLNGEEMREYRGTLKKPGKPSPYRDRSIEENLDLFEKMKNGEFKDGECVLRAKIDMTSPNMNMRDPAMYRIQRAHHHRTGDDWCIYPMYDWAHGLEDSIELVSHSLCSLEFEDHRPLYDWFLDQLDVPAHPRQIEFARLNMTYTMMSKRKLLEMVTEEIVDGWDDPRMLTLRGLRRRGFTPAALKDFISRIGVSKVTSTVDYAMLEHCLREDLNKNALRRMAVLDPLKVVITNYPEGQVEWLDAENNPENPDAGQRQVPFSRELYIEQEDFMEDPPKKFFRLGPGREVRLKHAYYITCNDVIKNEAGEIVELHCTYDPASKGGWTDDGRKVRGTSHWVAAATALTAEVRHFDKMFVTENPDEGGDWKVNLNPDSREVLDKVYIEPSLADVEPGQGIQFLRKGYYCADSVDFSKEKPVFNRSVSLKEGWSVKKAKK